MPFERKRVLDDLAEEVFRSASGLERGDVLPLEDIERHSGFIRYTGSWSSIVKRLKRLFLRRRRIALWPEIGIGYRLTRIEEQLHDVPRKRERRARRQVAQAAREVGALPARELSAQEAQYRMMKLRQLREEENRLRRASALTRRLTEGGETVPQVAAGRPGLAPETVT